MSGRRLLLSLSSSCPATGGQAVGARLEREVLKQDDIANTLCNTDKANLCDTAIPWYSTVSYG